MGGKRAREIKPGKRQRPARPEAGQLPRGRAGQTLTAMWSALSLDLLHPNYAVDKTDLSVFEDACRAHCYVCAEAAWHLFARRQGFVPYVHAHDFGTHWWLQHEETGEILDPSLPQHGGQPYPYELGRRATFLTKQPSKRAKELIRRVKARREGRY